MRVFVLANWSGWGRSLEELGTFHMGKLRTKFVAVLAVAGVVAGLQMTIGGGAQVAQAAQDDAGTGRDAGNLFVNATRVVRGTEYEATLDRASRDRSDFFKIAIQKGEAVSVLVKFTTGASEPVSLVDPTGRIVDTGTSANNWGVSMSADAEYPTGRISSLRLSVQHALVAGDYRLQVTSERLDIGSYSFCFMFCETPMDAPIDTIFGGSLPTARTKVLMVPPAHGDLGNLAGPTVFDYIEATKRGIHRWIDALQAFAAKYPEYGYLADITAEIEVFDGLNPVDPVGYDVVLGYVAAGPVFRGIASDDEQFGVEQMLRYMGFEDTVRFTGRAILLSLFGSAPRAGQAGMDFPEVNDLEGVTLHEFAHTFGLGHTRTIDPTFGPDLMNSPATFVYGDGWAAGDGGERTELECITSLNLYGMAKLYEWLPQGTWKPTYQSFSLPDHIPYERFC